MSTRPRVIAQPDTIILHLERLLFEYLLDGHNLAGSLLDFFELSQKVPEATLCNNIVGSKDTHLVKRRAGLLGARSLASNNLILVKLLK
jgi:hypothetical protein